MEHARLEPGSGSARGTTLGRPGTQGSRGDGISISRRMSKIASSSSRAPPPGFEELAKQDGEHEEEKINEEKPKATKKGPWDNEKPDKVNDEKPKVN